MLRIPVRLLLRALPVVAFVGYATAPAHGQYGAKNGEWRTYGGELGSTRYAPLDQINRENFGKLEIAWRFRTDKLGPRPDFNFQATPLMVNGVIYTTAGSNRDVIALNAATGELLWLYRIDEGKRAQLAPRKLSGRGVAYWSDGRGDDRVFFVTIGYQLVGLDAKTGQALPDFGKKGVIDLKQQIDQEGVDLESADIGLHATPVVAKDVVIVGAAHSSGMAPKSRNNIKGFVRGFDVRTGKRLWIFHTVPRPGEFGNDTWEKDSWAYTGNTGVWAQITVDEETDTVYLPVENPTGDYYGGHRPGNTLFADSILAVDLKTGARKWHFQTTHHDIWDRDLPCAPILVDITVDGRKIKALAQATKQGFLFVLDRETGKPVWPIEERPVPQSDVPGEKTSPTQPYPTKPPAYERQGITEDDLIDFTPALREEAKNLLAKYKTGPLFTPPIVRTEGGLLGTMILPSIDGGTSWTGGSFDPDTGIYYVFSQTTPFVLSLAHDPARSDMDYINRSGGGGGDGEGGGATPRVQGLPIIKPPWGRITAIDLNKGDIAWQVAHGETPDDVRNNPLLKGLDIPRTGRPARAGGTLVTKTLLIIGELGFFTNQAGQRTSMLWAYDKATGERIGGVPMPIPQSGGPITYMLNGKQYIVVPVSPVTGGAVPAELVAYRLP